MKQNTEPEALPIEKLIYRLVDRYFEAEVLQGKLANIPPQQIFAIQYLGEQGLMTMSELARRLCLIPSTLTGLVDRLAKRGYVERQSGVDDRRIVRVRLTEAGLKMYEEFNAYRRKFAGRLLKYLNTRQRRELGRHLRIILAGMDRDFGEAGERAEV